MCYSLAPNELSLTHLTFESPPGHLLDKESLFIIFQAQQLTYFCQHNAQCILLIYIEFSKNSGKVTLPLYKLREHYILSFHNIIRICLAQKITSSVATPLVKCELPILQTCGSAGLQQCDSIKRYKLLLISFNIPVLSPPSCYFMKCKEFYYKFLFTSSYFRQAILLILKKHYVCRQVLLSLNLISG